MSVLELIAVLLTAVALLGYFNHRVLRLPDTIGITAVGVLVCLGLALVGRAVPGAAQWAQGLASRFDFPELVLHGLLSVLLFAGSLHVNLADLARQKLPVLVLTWALGWLVARGFSQPCERWLRSRRPYAAAG